jgi:hypothetical protein
VETGDILTLVGGLVLVLIIAFATNPHYLSGISAPGTPITTAPTPVSRVPELQPAIIPVVTITSPPASAPVPVRPDDPPYRIFYSSQPLTYPRFKLPENMETFGAADLPMRNEALVPFAYIEDTRGGLTQTFSVPYPVWVLNTTVIANRTPQYGNFKLALCYAANGTILNGDEILNRGTSYRILQTSNTDMYLIITTANIDRYRISLEAPRG